MPNTRPNATRRSEATQTKGAMSTRPFAATGFGGQALDNKTQARMSAQFGHDFSQVRIHTDARAADTAGALGADAFAKGGDIFFGDGQFRPGSRETDRLLAHELTHVVQQAQHGPGGASRMSRRDDASEQEADALSAQVLAGQSVQAQATPGAAIAREEAEEEHAKVGGGEHEPEDYSEVGEGMARTIDFGKNMGSVMGLIPESVGLGFEGVSETVKRMGRGQGFGEAAGGGGLSALTGGLLGKMSEEAEEGAEHGVEAAAKHGGGFVGHEVFKGWEGSKGLTTAGSLIGSGMKMVGSALDSGKSEEEREASKRHIGVADVGDYIETGSKVINPAELAREGIKQGTMSLYNTGAALVHDSLNHSDSHAGLEKLNRTNLSGGNGNIIQGWSEIGDLAAGTMAGAMTGAEHGHGAWGTIKGLFGGAADGLGQEMDHLAPMAGQSSLGKLGNWLGDKEYNGYEYLTEKRGELGEWASEKASAVGNGIRAAGEGVMMGMPGAVGYPVF